MNFLLLDSAIKKYMLPAVVQDFSANDQCSHNERKTHILSLKEIINRIWSSEEAYRFAAFACLMPDLLDEDELRLWELILETSYFWEYLSIPNNDSENRIFCDNNLPVIFNQRKLVKNRLREKWSLIKLISKGDEDIDKLNVINLSG